MIHPPHHPAGEVDVHLGGRQVEALFTRHETPCLGKIKVMEKIGP
jgi:hypothetical protein